MGWQTYELRLYNRVKTLFLEKLASTIWQNGIQMYCAGTEAVEAAMRAARAATKKHEFFLLWNFHGKQ